MSKQLETSKLGDEIRSAYDEKEWSGGAMLGWADDVDALLAMVPFVAEVKEWAETHDELMVGDERDWETEAVDRDRVISEWMSKTQDILDALPEHLKGG